MPPAMSYHYLLAGGCTLAASQLSEIVRPGPGEDPALFCSEVDEDQRFSHIEYV
jgi:hypothetical protein